MASRGGFEWDSVRDQDLYRSLASLVKYNDGFWKSDGQRRFMLKNIDPVDARKPDWMRTNFGIDGVQDHHRVIHVSACMVWRGVDGKIGRRSFRRVEWMFVVDGAGIVGQYKLRFKHNDGASAVDPKRTEIVWERPVDMADKADKIMANNERRKQEAKAEAKRKRAESTSAPEGRHQVTGKVISAREEADRYSYNGGVIFKMLVEDDRGFRVWTTVPSGLTGVGSGSMFTPLVERIKGKRVTFMAQLQPKADDPLFAIGKRPTKASYIVDNQ